MEKFNPADVVTGQNLIVGDWVVFFKFDSGYRTGFGEASYDSLEPNYKNGLGRVLRVDRNHKDPDKSTYWIRTYVIKSMGTYYLWDLTAYPGEYVGYLLSERNKIEASQYVTDALGEGNE